MIKWSKIALDHKIGAAVICVAFASMIVAALTPEQVRKTGPVGQGEILTCFTPGEDCTQFVVDVIRMASKEILVQAYNYTSEPILLAIANAKKEGKVSVAILLDKTNEQERYCPKYAINRETNPLIDYKPAIAHNKVIIIDGVHVLTGSFNFTDSAQKRNAENIVLIKNNPAVAERYIANWKKRSAESREFVDHCALSSKQ